LQTHLKMKRRWNDIRYYWQVIFKKERQKERYSVESPSSRSLYADLMICATDQAGDFTAQDIDQTNNSTTQGVQQTSNFMTYLIFCSHLILDFPNTLLILRCATKLYKQYLAFPRAHSKKVGYCRICSAVHLIRNYRRRIVQTKEISCEMSASHFGAYGPNCSVSHSD